MDKKFKHIYVDTNVLINYWTNQKNDVEALNYVINKRRKEILFTSSLAVVQTITNLQTKKSNRQAYSRDKILEILDWISSKFTVLDLTFDDILNSKLENGNDVEDCVHAVVCKKRKCFAVFTNNTSDFKSVKDLCILPVKLGYLKSLIG